MVESTCIKIIAENEQAKSYEPIKALRFNEGKPEWTMIDFNSLLPLIKVLENGKEKYGRDNWKKKTEKDTLLNSMIRHWVALSNREERDVESGESHAAHIMANAMFYLYHFNDKETDRS